MNELLQTYFDVSARRDLDAVMALFAPDAQVEDEGHRHKGRPAIRAWRQDAWSRYTYTTQLTDVRDSGDGQWVVLTHLKGDFPGGEADLEQHFTIRDGVITALSHRPPVS